MVGVFLLEEGKERSSHLHGGRPSSSSVLQGMCKIRLGLFWKKPHTSRRTYSKWHYRKNGISVAWSILNGDQTLPHSRQDELWTPGVQEWGLWGRAEQLWWKRIVLCPKNKNQLLQHFQSHTLFPKSGVRRGSYVIPDGLKHIKSSRGEILLYLSNPLALRQSNILFQMAEFFSPFLCKRIGAFLNIDINLLSWKETKLLYFLSSQIVCTSDLFTKRTILHSHKSCSSSLLWY